MDDFVGHVRYMWAVTYRQAKPALSVIPGKNLGNLNARCMLSRGDLDNASYIKTKLHHLYMP